MKRILFIVILILLLRGGVYVFSTSKNNSGHMEMAGNETVVQSHRGYNVKLTSPITNLKPNQQIDVKYKIVDDQGNTLKDFAVDHTKIMHFIVVRSDLQYFQHLHPDFNKETGEFSVPIAFPQDGMYRLFADFIPGQGQMGPDGNPLGVTTSQDVNVGDINQAQQQEVIPDTVATKTLADYAFTYSFPQPLEAGKPVSIVINVKQNGEPVKNMEEYLGAQAHGIVLRKDDLLFTHLHAMGEEMTHEMKGETMSMHGALPKGPEIKFDYTFPEGGTYKLFTQFQHEGKVITTDYTIEVK